MLCAKVLLEEGTSLLDQLESILKLIKFLKYLPLDQVRLNLDVQLRHELVLSFLWAHVLKGLRLLLDL